MIKLTVLIHKIFRQLTCFNTGLLKRMSGRYPILEYCSFYLKAGTTENPFIGWFAIIISV